MQSQESTALYSLFRQGSTTPESQFLHKEGIHIS